MDQELKQRLIGAAVITALAAIFVPMLFDDPVNDTEKSISELKIPEIPAKQQEVEIMPLPEKAEEVASGAGLTAGAKPAPKVLEEEGPAEKPVTAPAPAPSRPLPPSGQLPHAGGKRSSIPVADEDMPVGEEEDVRPPSKPLKSFDGVQEAGNAPPPPKPAKIPPTAVKDVAPKAAEPAAADAATRWYLNAGSFSQKANAQALLDNLKQQGFPASIKETGGDKGAVYKVRVGPMPDRAKAQAVKNKLAQINVNSFVAPED